MADVTTVISRGAHVRGKLTGDGSVVILGRVDGDIRVDGEVIVEAGGLVASNVTAKRIVIRGAVKGDLTADEAIALEEGARVVGDVRAPRVAIQGALLKGYVQAGDVGHAPSASASRSQASRPAVRHAAPVLAKAVPPPLPPSTPRVSSSSNGSAAARPAPPPLPSRERERVAEPARAVSLAGGSPPAAKQGPPPPVVPALKKGAKGALKKKA